MRANAEAKVRADGLCIAIEGINGRICIDAVLQSADRRSIHARSLRHLAKAESLTFAVFLEHGKHRVKIEIFALGNGLARVAAGQQVLQTGPAALKLFSQLLQLPLLLWCSFNLPMQSVLSHAALLLRVGTRDRL
jgi:hypothetical protein